MESAKIGETIYKLMKEVGQPTWFQSAGMKKDESDNYYLFINVNNMWTSKVEEIPEEVDGIPVRVFYKNTIRNYYSTKAVPPSVRMQNLR